MFCPYVRKSYTKITGIHYFETTDNVQVEDASIIHEHFENAECRKEQCGAWYEGRCRYNERER